MIIKKAPSMNFFCFSTEATLMNLSKYVRVKAHETYLEAVKLNLEITGPVYWIYYGWMETLKPNSIWFIILTLCFLKNSTT